MNQKFGLHRVSRPQCIHMVMGFSARVTEERIAPSQQIIERTIQKSIFDTGNQSPISSIKVSCAFFTLLLILSSGNSQVIASCEVSSTKNSNHKHRVTSLEKMVGFVRVLAVTLPNMKSAINHVAHKSFVTQLLKPKANLWNYLLLILTLCDQSEKIQDTAYKRTAKNRGHQTRSNSSSPWHRKNLILYIVFQQMSKV